jgi:hypothetical protein
MSAPTIALADSDHVLSNKKLLIRPTKMLFHVKRNGFEREWHSNARLVRTVIEHSDGAALFSSRNKKGGLLAAFKNQIFPAV